MSAELDQSEGVALLSMWGPRLGTWIILWGWMVCESRDDIQVSVLMVLLYESGGPALTEVLDD
jgi:hypothetical protein